MLEELKNYFYYKYLAKYNTDDQLAAKVLAAAICVSLACTIVIGLTTTQKAATDRSQCRKVGEMLDIKTTTIDGQCLYAVDAEIKVMDFKKVLTERRALLDRPTGLSSL